ncbi:MAG: hypothetical protein WBQ17_06870 [Rhizomicrobium sp.]
MAKLLRFWIRGKFGLCFNLSCPPSCTGRSLQICKHRRAPRRGNNRASQMDRGGGLRRNQNIDPRAGIIGHLVWLQRNKLGNLLCGVLSEGFQRDKAGRLMKPMLGEFANATHRRKGDRRHDRKFPRPHHGTNLNGLFTRLKRRNGASSRWRGRL